MRFESFVLLVAAVAVATVFLVGLASATKPAPGGFTGTGSVLSLEPGAKPGRPVVTGQKDADTAVLPAYREWLSRTSTAAAS